MSFTSTLFRDGFTEPSLKRMFILSAGIHFFLITLLVLFPYYSKQRITFTPVYTVQLVGSLEKGEGKSDTLGKERATKKSELPPPEIKAKKSEEIKITSKKEAPDKIKKIEKSLALGFKKSEKAETLSQKEAEKNLKETISRLKAERSLKETIGGLKKQILAQKVNPEGKGGDLKGLPPIFTSSPLISSMAEIKFSLYYTEIWEKIREAWILPKGIMKGSKDLEAIITVKIRRNGEIVDLYFEKRSGSLYFDDSAIRTIRKVNPLPPLPQEFRGEYLEVGIRFLPSQL